MKREIKNKVLLKDVLEFKPSTTTGVISDLSPLYIDKEGNIITLNPSDIPSGGGIQSITGDFVNNTDPSNPVIEDPRIYKEYTALLTQVSTDAPVATILENTLGGIPVWSWDSAGYFLLTGVGLFSGTVTVNVGNEGTGEFIATSFPSDFTNDVVNLFVCKPLTPGVGENDILADTSITIRVYPG